MSTIIGRNCDVAISLDGVTYTEIANIINATLTINDDIADETNNDSGGFKEGKYADSQASLSVGCKYNSADAGQALVATAKFAKVPYYYRVRPIASGGELQWVFQGNMPSYDVNTETGAVEDMSFSVESTGSVGKTAQA